MTPEQARRTPSLFKPRDAVLWKTDRRNDAEVPGDKWWEGEIAPRGTAIAYYLQDGGGDVEGHDHQHGDRPGDSRLRRHADARASIASSGR